MVIVMKLFIGSSSRDEIDNKYKEACKSFLEVVFKNDNDLVFGADYHSIMGICYDTAKKYNRKVIGITPINFKDDIGDFKYDELVFTNNISERTYKVIEMCDGLIFMPGGIGSIYEFFSALEFIRSGEFDKPIVIFNYDNYYDNLIKMLEKMYKEKFASNKLYYYICNNAIDALEYINNYYIK